MTLDELKEKLSKDNALLEELIKVKNSKKANCVALVNVETLINYVWHAAIASVGIAEVIEACNDAIQWMKSTDIHIRCSDKHCMCGRWNDSINKLTAAITRLEGMVKNGKE